MIGLEDRRTMAQGILQAHAAGARLHRACEVAGIDERTLQRWQASDGLQRGDGRPLAARAKPAHALSQAERAQVLEVANEPRFADMPPARIVPMLADEGRDIASESTFSRILRAHGQNAHRGRARAPTKVPAEHARRHGAGRGLVLEHDRPARRRHGALVPPVPDPRPVQPQGHRLGGPRPRRR